MSNETNNSDAVSPLVGEVLEAETEPIAPSERDQSTTVGTGSYVAVSCTAMALLLTLVILAILFVVRWLT